MQENGDENSEAGEYTYLTDIEVVAGSRRRRGCWTQATKKLSGAGKVRTPKGRLRLQQSRWRRLG